MMKEVFNLTLSVESFLKNSNNTGYIGKRTEEGCVVYKYKDGELAGKLKHYVRHSPDGFEWGYYGSGPADLV